MWSYETNRSSQATMKMNIDENRGSKKRASTFKPVALRLKFTIGPSRAQGMHSKQGGERERQ